MRGRKPKPTFLKRLTGNPGRRPLNENEPQPKRTLPPCPDFLDEAARREWRRLTEYLYDVGILSELDGPALATYCQAFSRWQYAEEQLAKFGPVILSPDKKFPVQSPYLAIANKAMEQMLKVLIEFGMTPSSRSRVTVIPGRGLGVTGSASTSPDGITAGAPWMNEAMRRKARYFMRGE